MTFKRILLNIVLPLTAVYSVAKEAKTPINVFSRENISLNGKWNYIIDVQEMGYYNNQMRKTSHGFFENRKARKPTDLIEYDFDKAPVMEIPSDWNTKDERLMFYEGTVWFRKEFDYTKKEGKKELLYFGAVNYEAVVYVNGKEAGRHVGGFTPFAYDVTEMLHNGKNNVIVKVDNKRHKDGVPTQVFDWWNYGGITRDVFLVTVNNIYIEDYSIQLAKGNKNLIKGWVKLNTTVANEKIQLDIPELKIKRTVITDSNGKAHFELKAKPELWSPEKPKLYNVKLAKDDETINEEIGFRTIETKGKQILLNGKPVFLRGICVHEEKPFGKGRACGEEDAKVIFGWAKELGCNYVRLAHYPHNEQAVREAERMGLMVWSEIPLYWNISWTNNETYKNAEKQLDDMISRDKNRAAVIIWSIANETAKTEARNKFLGKLAETARQKDSTRMISMAMEVLSASNYVNILNDEMHKYVDIISFNQYVGWYRNVNDAHKMKWEIPYDKPVIISEFGGGAVYGRHGTAEERWTEEFQENLYKINLKMIESIDGLAGTSPWVLADFRSPRRPLDDTQDFFNRKGLYTEKGEKKKAFYIVKEWYNNKKEEYK
ncbi:glycoside hydrolase family 2 protein [Xylanibacter muris]|uniref:Beta-glucuronidase n=1 Tax=Xylanibacter muris TaxID=2736290 RepID=A0ABX2AJZ1_9BACT|nr:glycoside hydrolase family 2 TIM barrel-domain containing protein [Xylanibacter muris]NPD91491.1 beta-glucuronidase [Xylanibacter muris]